ATLRCVSQFDYQGFIFADEETTNETHPVNVIGDFGIIVEGGGPIAFINLRTGVLIKKKASTSLNQITTADESGYGTFADPGAAGDSFLFKLANNTYGAIEITSLTPSGLGFNATIRYKYQPNGTRNF
ncbi:MAG: hypothetical protein KKD47_07095, partial [Proteobacteria bacterium]|nr:hypothetical protein [Pseudomonadota bacterium]